MKKNILLLTLLVFGAFTINAQSFFGEKIDNSELQSMGDIYKELQKKETINTKIEGTIVDVCSVKGCWMNISDGEGHDFFVKFKDYGFFMPKDAAGQKVVARGMAYIERVSVDELRHYAEDAGKNKEEIAKITASELSYHFLADGIILMDKVK